MKFKTLIAQHDYTVASLASDLGCSRAYLYQLIEGSRDPMNCSYCFMVKMSKLIGEFPETIINSLKEESIDYWPPV